MGDFAKNDVIAERSTRFGARPAELWGEAVGTGFLLAGIVGSGIMAEKLANGNVGLALFMHAATVGALLVVLVLSFGAVSGAHFNPAVTFAFWLRREIASAKAVAYVLVQLIAAIIGVVVAHLMFEMPMLAVGEQARTGAGQWLGEMVATFALVFAILATVRHARQAVPYAVGLVVMSGILYTSSTCFANPAVTVARAFTDTFTAIRPVDAFGFIAAQLLAAALAVGAARVILAEQE